MNMVASRLRQQALMVPMATKEMVAANGCTGGCSCGQRKATGDHNTVSLR